MRVREPSLRFTDDFGSPPERTANGSSLLVDNPALIAPPKDSPPRYAWQRVVEFTDFASWPAVSKRFAPLFAAAAVLPANSPLKQEAAQIAAAHADPLGRAQAALQLVQEQVRYVYVGLDGGNYRPASAEETWQRRYGDCKGKTALLLALLGELGVPAQAVLVNSSRGDDGLASRLPSPGLFDHVIVRAQIAGKAFWLDGTLPEVVEMGEQPALPYRSVLPLTAEGSGLVELERPPAALPDEMGIYDIDARDGFDKPARMTETMVKRGADAIVQYLQLSALTSEQMTQAFRNAAAGGDQWETIDKVSYRFDRPTQAGILTISGLAKVDWEKEDSGVYELVLPGGGFIPPSARKRQSDEDQSAPFYTEPSFNCYATTVRLPNDTPLDNWAFNSVFDTMMFGKLYYRMMERGDDRTIRLVRGSRVERPEIDAGTAKRDNERLERFDNSKAKITYDPATVARPWGNLQPVPATYELDWTSAAAPCLPKDVRRALDHVAQRHPTGPDRVGAIGHVVAIDLHRTDAAVERHPPHAAEGRETEAVERPAGERRRAEQRNPAARGTLEHDQFDRIGRQRGVGRQPEWTGEQRAVADDHRCRFEGKRRAVCQLAGDIHRLARPLAQHAQHRGDIGQAPDAPLERGRDPRHGMAVGPDRQARDHRQIAQRIERGVDPALRPALPRCRHLPGKLPRVARITELARDEVDRPRRRDAQRHVARPFAQRLHAIAQGPVAAVHADEVSFARKPHAVARRWQCGDGHALFLERTDQRLEAARTEASGSRIVDQVQLHALRLLPGSAWLGNMAP